MSFDKAAYWANKGKKPERFEIIHACSACGTTRGPFEKNKKGQLIHRGCPKWTSMAVDRAVEENFGG